MTGMKRVRMRRNEINQAVPHLVTTCGRMYVDPIPILPSIVTRRGHTPMVDRDVTLV